MNLWSDEDRLFIPRLLGLSINFKYIAKKLGLIKRVRTAEPADRPNEPARPASTDDRLRDAIDRSRFEDR